ncbi:AAA family ATPase [Wielerella bovis]|uniref:AAA family ATPase n=1 Tax=Wielerella bovis TaxID=2917790 RepID=UPI002018B82D|nr:AAA family ATPase [Wielerella bovis]MCG7656244.1 ATP-binding protein [Wielerella bovis]MCG7658469.1 ATP-binding protein [Wielerella bovis]
MNDLLNGVVRFEGVKGVGKIEVDFVPNQRVYTFIGANGVGKTKLLECLFTVLFLNLHKIDCEELRFKDMPCTSVSINQKNWLCAFEIDGADYFVIDFLDKAKLHNLPIVYLAAQSRGNIQSNNNSIQKIGSYQQRSEKYLEKLFSVFRQPENFKSLNMDTNLEEWIIQRAQSANPYQSKADNRKIELDTLLSILNQIDERIDSEFLEISGDNRVFIKVSGDKRELAELSSGFTSILKMVQSIIAGYSYFTNEQQIARVRGVVLIDEIESHLHNEWQVKIIPLLKKLFPNTTFLITTHSSLVISQLEQGEAYRLKRNLDDGVVYGEVVDYPAQSSIVDLLDTAFDVDLTAERSKWRGNREEAKAALLALLERDDDIWEQENE